MRCHSNLQMSLPLPCDEWNENALREAHRAAHIRMPFKEAMRNRALEICLRCFAEARLRRRGQMTLREAARRAGRDVRPVHGDVHALPAAGVLRRDANRKIEFPLDLVHVDFMLKAP